jgi:dipeptidyl-peptidase-3
VTQAEIELVQAFLESKHINAYNTRLFKDDKGVVTVRLASAETKPMETNTYQGKVVQIAYGDYAEVMKQISTEMEAAIPYSANENQRKMLEKYLQSFRSGSIDAHKDSQRYVTISSM